MKKSGDTILWSKGSNRRRVSHSPWSREQETLCEINELHHSKCMGTSILNLDLVHATGVKPQTRLGIDIRGLWAALPLHRQDTDSLQPEDLLRSSS